MTTRKQNWETVQMNSKDLNDDAGDILILTKQNKVATITLNRPKQFNSLSKEMLTKLGAALEDINNDTGIMCVVIQATGKAFCAGHDLKQMRDNPDRQYYQDLFDQCGGVMQSIVNLSVPVIAKVQGIATAAGCQLVASCDLAIASEQAKFAVSGINVGLFCSTPSVALTRSMPIKKAFEMLVTGNFIDANEAANHGLINRAVPADQLDNATQDLINAICAKSPVAIRTGKAMYKRQLGMSLPDAYCYASDVMAGNMMAQDACEGIDAFIQKRHPNWKGC